MPLWQMSWVWFRPFGTRAVQATIFQMKAGTMEGINNKEMKS